MAYWKPRLLCHWARRPAEQELEGDATQYEREMGGRIEPFHMREERATGHFDGAGFWVRDREDDATVCPLPACQRALTTKRRSLA